MDTVDTCWTTRVASNNLLNGSSFASYPSEPSMTCGSRRDCGPAGPLCDSYLPSLLLAECAATVDIEPLVHGHSGSASPRSLSPLPTRIGSACAAAADSKPLVHGRHRASHPTNLTLPQAGDFFTNPNPKPAKLFRHLISRRNAPPANGGPADKPEQSLHREIYDGGDHRPASAAPSCPSLDNTFRAREAVRLRQTLRPKRAERREQAGAGRAAGLLPRTRLHTDLACS